MLQSERSYNHIFVFGGHKLAYRYYQALEANLGFQSIQCVSDKADSYIKDKIPSENWIHKSPAQFLFDLHNDETEINENDIVIPDHTAKHILLMTFLEMAKKKFPDAKCELQTIENLNMDPPFLYKSENDALWAMSYATWTCPPDCDEPETCPHTKSKRHWNFFEDFQNLEPQENTLDFIFGCKPVHNEISFISLEKVQNELKRFDQNAKPGHKIRVATHSHCHGIIGQLGISKGASQQA